VGGGSQGVVDSGAECHRFWSVVNPIQGTSLMLTTRLDRVVGSSRKSGVGGLGVSLGVRFEWSGCLLRCVGLSGQSGFELTGWPAGGRVQPRLRL
jgi:hypothetical protein